MATYDWSRVRAIVLSDAWRQSFVIAPPLPAAALAELEARLGVRLPEGYRSFVTEVTCEVQGLHLLHPGRAALHLVDPATAFPVLAREGLPDDLDPRRFGFGEDEARAAMDRLAALLAGIGSATSADLWKLAGSRELLDAALPGNEFHQGALVAIDLGCGEQVAVVVDGPLHGQVWRETESGWYPEFTIVDGAPRAQGFAGWIEAYVAMV